MDKRKLGNLTVSEMAKRKGATNAQISLAWMLHKYPHVVPIPGSKNKERILENLGACNVKMTDADIDTLRELVSEDAAFTRMSGTHHWEKRDGEWIAVHDSHR